MTVIRGRDGANRAGKKIEPGHDALPFDLPASLYVDRHIKDGGLVGWSLHIEPLAHGDHKIEIKFVHGGAAAIFLDGEQVGAKFK